MAYNFVFKIYTVLHDVQMVVNLQRVAVYCIQFGLKEGPLSFP